MTATLFYTLIPVVVSILAAAVALKLRPGPRLVSAIQHFAAGVVFAAAAGEILPDVKHGAAPVAMIIGGALAVGVMLLVKQVESYVKGPTGLVTTIGIDILVDGLVLGIAFAAGAKAGVLLTIALTLEVMFLGLALVTELSEAAWRPAKILVVTGLLMLLLPLGAVLAVPVTAMPDHIVTGFLSFGLVALLYLVTEELLVEAHETPDTPWVTALFFAGFLMLLLLEELMA